MPPTPPAPAFDKAVADQSLAICGEILSRARSLWGVDRYSTDSIWNVSFHISKAELLPGDAVNLTTGRDPKRLGHIRLFEAWANAAHTVMWVYEETPPRSVHRVVVYDDRYQPIRLSGLSGAGVALIVPGTPAPERTATPRAPRPTAKPTPLPTAKATTQASPRPTTTARPTISAATTPRPTPTPTPTAR